MMKKSSIIALFWVLCSVNIFAQDEQKILLSAYVADNCGVPSASTNILESKLKNVITSCGFGEEMNQRFILTAKVNILTEDVTPTTPPMFAYNLSYDLFIGDGMTGIQYASTQISAKGVGKTKDKAYMMGLKSLNPNSPEMKRFVEMGKKKIVDYYNANGESILQKAQMLVKNQQFDEALWELSAIPSACPNYYTRACDLMVLVYQKSIDYEGQKLLAQARAIWNAGLDRDAADKAGALLSQINPQSSSYKQAATLGNQIAARVKSLDSREWSFLLQREKDETSIRKAQINSARDIAVAWAKNQPRTIYRIYWW